MNWQTKLIQKLIQVNEWLIFYPRLRRFYKTKFAKNDVVSMIDVGANKGQSIDFFKGLFPKAEIAAFEPNLKLYKYLGQKYAAVPEISIQNVGISSREGALEFYENVLDETSTFEQLNPESAYLKRKARLLGVSAQKITVASYKVNVISLSDFIEKSGRTTFDILKIDVEGHELQCLQGLFDKNNFTIRFIQIESHNDDMYLTNNSAAIHGILTANQYSVVARIKHGFGDFEELIYEYNNQ